MEKGKAAKHHKEQPDQSTTWIDSSVSISFNIGNQHREGTRASSMDYRRPSMDSIIDCTFESAISSVRAIEQTAVQHPAPNPSPPHYYQHRSRSQLPNRKKSTSETVVIITPTTNLKKHSSLTHHQAEHEKKTNLKQPLLSFTPPNRNKYHPYQHHHHQLHETNRKRWCQTTASISSSIS